MGAMSGSDANELDRLSHQISGVSKRLTSGQARLGSALHSSPWRGTNADRFRQQWDGEYRKSVIGAGQFLTEATNALRENARQQRDASGIVHSSNSAAMLLGSFATVSAGLVAVARWFSIAHGSKLEMDVAALRWRDSRAVDLGNGVTAEGSANVSVMHASAAVAANSSLGAGGLDAAAHAGLGLNAVDAHADGRLGTDELSVGASADGSVGASADADGKLHLGPDGAAAAIGAGAYAGLQISGKASADLGGVKPAMKATAYAGIGGHANADLSVTPQRVTIKLDVGAALVLGAGVSTEIDIEPARVARNISHFFDPFH